MRMIRDDEVKWMICDLKRIVVRDKVFAVSWMMASLLVMMLGMLDIVFDVKTVFGIENVIVAFGIMGLFVIVFVLFMWYEVFYEL